MRLQLDAATDALLDPALPDGPPRWRFYARHRLDITGAALARGLLACLHVRDEREQAERVERCVAPSGGALATLSVRSAFDLLLEALAFPRGAQLVMSAVTIPDMARIAEAHGLEVVPVELDRDTLAPNPEALAKAITPRTRAIVVAHLFGGRMDLEPTLALASRYGLPLIEDCAQAFLGPRHAGHPGALASMFSFGSIKTCTALGGAVTHVRDAALLQRMRALHEARPAQSRCAFGARVARFVAVSRLIRPTAYALLSRACSAFGADFEAALQSAVKGFPGGAEAMLSDIRRRPSAPLLSLLAHRLERFDGSRLAARAANGERLRAVAGVRLPGHLQPVRTHWLVPFVSAAPAELCAVLRAHGFDAGQGTTSLTALEDLGASWLRRVVYLPAYPEIPAGDVDRLVALLQRSSNSVTFLSSRP